MDILPSPWEYIIGITSLVGTLFSIYFAIKSKKLSAYIVSVVFIFILTSFATLLIVGPYAYKKGAREAVEKIPPPPTTKGIETMVDPTWISLSDEIFTSGEIAWDTSDFQHDEKENAFCTKGDRNAYFVMRRSQLIPFSFNEIEMRFFVVDQREETDEILWFYFQLYAKDPKTGGYDIPLSLKAIPVDGIERRTEFKRYFGYSQSLQFKDNPGHLSQPADPAKQIELSLLSSTNGDVLQQLYTVGYTAVGSGGLPDSDSFSHDIEKLPFTSIEGQNLKMGIGISVGGCIQNFEYTIN